MREHGIVLAGQTRSLAPADGAIYALRDVTATVSSLPLIASSIMSKKLAAGANAIVLDVKVGLGAFMHNLDDARALAQIMVDIGTSAGRKMVALLSDMNQPLGKTVGNALEVREAIEALHGGGPTDLREHCLVVAGHMVRLGQRDASPDALPNAIAELADTLDGGRAFDKFRELIAAQGGDVSVVDDPSKLPQAPLKVSIPSPQAGYVAQVNALLVAQAALELGAGRARKGDAVNPAVGVEVHHKVGDQITPDDAVFTVHAADETALGRAKELLGQAVTISSQPHEPLPMFYATIYGD